MGTDYRCFFCLTRAFEKLLARESIPVEAKNNFTLEMISLYNSKWDKISSPEFARELHNLLKSKTGNPDPYRDEKRFFNDVALKMLPVLRQKVMQSDDPFETALRLSLAGNIIDFAANGSFDLDYTIEKALSAEFAIDNSKHLKQALAEARSVLFLGDNAGEIVFDRLFIETIRHPDLTFVVRGGPVINDATLEDAVYTGIDKVARVISNGHDAPSTLLHRSDNEFLEHFKNSDLIISKGQGNLEGLIDLNDKRIFFLLMSKCDVMSEFLNVEKGSLIVYNATIHYLNSK